jgi:hypothetical protein
MSQFNVTSSKLTVNPGVLSYNANHSYQVFIKTVFLNAVYSQTLTITIVNVPSVPLVTLL